MRFIRFIALFTVLVLVVSVSFSACSGNNSDNSSIQTETQTEDITEMTKKPKEETMNRDAEYTYHKEEIYVENGDILIYGVAYIPDRDTRMPLVVFSHGLGASSKSAKKYAEAIAEKGFCVYAFDFCGGTIGGNNTTYKPTTEMSVMTEANDLSAVLRDCVNWDFVDSDNIFFMGESQGGAVSTVIACEQPEKIKGMILIYPAFCIPDLVHQVVGSLDDSEDVFPFFDGAVELGRVYAEDVWNYDFYSEIPKYDGNVLLIHGDKDTVVDISYSDRASKTFKNCEYHVIEGAGHGFNDEDTETAISYTLDFLYNNFS